nr:immunoglobulin mu heavy chain [Bos taurus]
MNPLWTLLFVLSAPRGVLSQVQLRESGPSLVKPSQTLSLTCTVSGFSLSNNGVSWVRQAPRKALEWLGYIDTDEATSYNPGLKSRLSITKDNSKSQVSLAVDNVTTEDAATYYCITVQQKACVGRWWRYDGYHCAHVADGSGLWDHADAWGQGLLVTVSSEGESHPRVFT